MKRLVNLLKQDIAFQLKHGFYAIYALITIIYIVILQFVPAEYKSLAVTAIIFTDPSTLGLFFIGGIVLLERGQNILQPLFITPVQVHQYLLSKVISLTLIAVLVSLVIKLALFYGDFFLLPLIVGVSLSAIFFTLLGIIFATLVKNVNQYLLFSPVYVTIFYLPILELFGWYQTKWFYLLPSHASILLIAGSRTGLTQGEWLYAIGSLLIWSGIAFIIAWQIFYRRIVLRLGG